MRLDLGLNLGCFNGNVLRGVLDLLTVSSAAAYSLRKLRTAYTGNAIRVRRSQDNAELDIGFTPNAILNTAALLTFVGANDGFVTTWYDQSGNSRHVTQATAANQPQIVTAGVVNTENGKPVINSNFKWLSNSAVSNDASLWGGNPQTMNAVARSSSSNDRDFFALLGGTATTSNLRSLGAASGGTDWRYTTGLDIFGSGVAINTYSIGTGRYSASTNNIRVNGVLRSTGSGTENTTAGELTIGARNPSGGTAGTFFIGECILFNVSLSDSDALTLERNQGAYYGITVA
jgi:hypothetical protein